MKKIKKTMAALAVCGAVALALAACGGGGAGGKAEKGGAGEEAEKGGEKITFCLDWTPNTNHTGVYVAKALGYYEEKGLDVEIVQPPEDGALQMCAAGRAQFAVDAQDTMAPAIDGDDPLGVTAVAAILAHNTSGVMSRKGDGLTRPKGLEGKTYSTWNNPMELKMLEYVVGKDGGNFSKVTLIPNDITDEPAALAAGQTDAVWVFYGWSGVNASVEKVDVDFWNIGAASPKLDYYTPVIVAGDGFLEEKPEVAKAFLAATSKGYKYAAKNPQKAAEILMAGDETGSLEGAKDLVMASQEWISKRYVDDQPQWGWMEPKRWDKFYGWLYKNGLTEKDLTGKGYSDDYLPKK